MIFFITAIVSLTKIMTKTNLARNGFFWLQITISYRGTTKQELEQVPKDSIRCEEQGGIVYATLLFNAFSRLLPHNTNPGIPP